MGENFKKYEYVEHVERTNETTITLKGTRMNTTLEFATPQECLKRFLEIRKEYEEAWRFAGPKIYRDGSKW